MRGILGGLAAVIVLTLVTTTGVRAASTGVVIRSVQAAGATATTELIELSNNGGEPVDVTSWTIAYTRASGVSTTTLVKLQSPDASTRLIMDAGVSEMIASTDYAAGLKDKTGLVTFTGGMSHLGGALTLRDGAGNVVDMLGWGTVVKNFETSPAPTMTSTTLLRRGEKLDTDNNAKDFTLVTQASVGTYLYGQLREVEDFCPNIEGIQVELPVGLVRDAKGSCVSPFIPAKLRISELLPNAHDGDEGKEFIEIYNPEIYDVDLADYSLKVGTKTYGFPDGAKLKANEYRAFSDEETGIILPNTTGVVVTLLARGEMIDQTETYQNAPDDEAWARFESEWKFTNQPTPNAPNSVRIEAMDETADVTLLAACKEGYYRYEITNRCRKIPVTAAPAPCKEGQYRSEETGRCRSIASAAAATLKPCADDQFRNPATGRCKKIASTDDLPKPCKDGYERNAETNRCRKSLLSTMPNAAFPVEPIKQVSQGAAIWWALGGVGVTAVGYGAWDWRSEIIRILRRTLGLVSFGRL